MEINATKLWIDLDHFEDWVTRNCISCRWRYRPNPEWPTNDTCCAARICLLLFVRKQPIPEEIINTIFPPSRRPITPDDAQVPFICGSKRST